jgi:eukaryotic-like serine/threonine-protein kinase
MSTVPKWPPDGSGAHRDRTDKDEREQTAVLSPPPGESASGEVVRPSDAPTLIDITADTSPGVSTSDAPTILDAGPNRPFRRISAEHHSDEHALPPGSVLGQRYEIVTMLGEGGMGAVYQAIDRELNRPVALKVIRPELAKNKAIIERFKQELLLAREVTHRNVIRIYDLGEADGIKFITMEFVQGEDLRTMLLRQKKLAPEDAVDIIQQICRALEAAHTAGIIHRDLKPQNVMRDKSGRILVMDFGLARMVEGDGMTQTGALVGTMDYMSPEQALGKPLDQRSDLYTVGLIFYELLTGKMPFAAESALASLIKRTQERAAPVLDSDKAIPVSLSNVVGKCLERDIKLRYQSTAELLADLDAWGGKRAANALTFHANVGPWARGLPWPLIATILTVLVLAASGWMLRGRLFGPTHRSVAGPQVSLAILPFRNASGDASLDWLGPSLADMLSTDVGQSASLRTVSQDRLHQVISDLRISPNASIDPTTLRSLAEFSSADTLVSGQYARFGGQIRIDATLQDLKHDRVVPIKLDAVDEKDIPGAVDRMATSIRNNLAMSSDAIEELKASSFQPSSRSAAALRDYNQGVQFLRDGKNLDAVKVLRSATKEDTEFALAYSRLAEADSALGYDGDAEQASRRASDLSQSLPLVEKYLIEAAHARIVKDNKRAIQAYENLAKSMPENAEVQSGLADLYTATGNYVQARAQLTKLLSADPKNIKALWQMGVVEIVSGNPQAAFEPLNKGVSLAVQVDVPELKGLMLQSMGISYRLMNKPDEAMRNYEQAMAINQRLGLKRALASNLVEMAIVQNTQGKVDNALSDYTRALQLQRDIGMKKEVGDTLIDMGVVYEAKGDYDKALQNYKESLQIQRDTGDENYQALCLNNIGGVYFAKGDSDNALTYLQQALQLREKLNVAASVAETLSALGQVYIGTGQYDQALATSMRALDLWRKAKDARGAADESHDIGLVFQKQGRFGAAVNAMQDAVNGYRTAGDRGSDMTTLLIDLADSLAQAGRGAEADPLLREAEISVRDLKNETLKAELLSAEGNIRRYSGDTRGAEALYEQALQSAQRAKTPEQILISRLHSTEMAMNHGNPDSAAKEFRKLTEEADGRNLKYLSLESSVDTAEALIARKDYAGARQELEAQLSKSEKLGSRFQSARIHYLLGTALRSAGNEADASPHYRMAVKLIDEVQKDGAEKLLQRSDVKAMFTEASRYSANN